MDASTLAGIVIGIVCIFVSMILEGGNPASLIAPSSAILVFGGTFGAAMAGILMKDLGGIMGVVKTALAGKVVAADNTVSEIVQFAGLHRTCGRHVSREEAQSHEKQHASHQSLHRSRR